jgi:pimeloyl-ACP methyl ester carboxylesterase
VLEFRQYGDPAGHPTFFFHGLIGSHFQASYVDTEARENGLRVIAWNRPGVGRSDFVRRATALDAVSDVEDVARALGLAEFSVIGISGGTPYALAVLDRLPDRVRTTTVISGMGPTRLSGALKGMERRRRTFLGLGSRYPRIASRVFHKAGVAFSSDPRRFLDRLIATWVKPDQTIFRDPVVYDLFLRDLRAVFSGARPAEGLAQELGIYRNYGVSPGRLRSDRRVTLWHGLDDSIVPPSMAWAMSRELPNCEAHLVPGGHFVAVVIADQIISRLRKQLDANA